MIAQQPENARGEYGPPADMYRRIARSFNRTDYPFAAVLLTARNGVILPPDVLNLFDARGAWEWWRPPRLDGYFYGALFNNQWLDRGPVTLVREFLRGGKWLGPIQPPGLAM